MPRETGASSSSSPNIEILSTTSPIGFVTLVGKPEAVVTIHGGMHRDDDGTLMERFTQDKEVQILVATDAAGEGINLQRAHLMVNYDLPWNPNRIEQRFGRIHRIGQTEICHLWNLVAAETREGEVFKTLFLKLEEQRGSLGGSVFDILGKIFQNVRLRDLLIEAIRYGERPEVKARLLQTLDHLLNKDQCIALLEERALAHDTLDDRPRSNRSARRWSAPKRAASSPHFVQSLFLEAFRGLGGVAREREPKRFELTHVPTVIRNRGPASGAREPNPGQVRANHLRERAHQCARESPWRRSRAPAIPYLTAPSTSFLNATESYSGAAPFSSTISTVGTVPRALVYLEHAIQDAQNRIGRAVGESFPAKCNS